MIGVILIVMLVSLAIGVVIGIWKFLMEGLEGGL